MRRAARSLNGPGGRTGERAAITLLLLLSIGGGLLATAPLWVAPSHRLPANTDVYLKAWGVAWVAHQLVRDPSRLFEANMFFPHANSLLYDDSALTLGLLALPLRALGASVALAFNLLLLLSFPVAALGAYVFARHMGASRGGAILAGIGFSYCTYRWDHIVHLQSLWVGLLPLTLVLLRRTLRTARLADAVGLALATLLQILTSGYYAWLQAAAIGVVLLFEFVALRSRRALSLVVGSLLFAFVGAAPELLARRELVRRHGFTRTLAEAEHWSAAPRSYLDPGPYPLHAPGSVLHRLFEHGEPLFPGLGIGVLALLGITHARRERDCKLLLLLFGAGALLSFGPYWTIGGVRMPAPGLLLRSLPGGDLLRTPSRFGVLALLALSTLAGICFSRLAFEWPRRRRLAALGVLLAFTLYEGYPGDLRRLFQPAPVFPPSAVWLRSAARGAVLELPWSGPDEAARYLYWSTAHWQPLVNGFASFEPPGNLGLGLLGNRWPSEYSARVFGEAGIRYVVVHTKELKPLHQERLLSGATLPGNVRLLAILGDDRVYGILPKQ
jgi:hypothetical protein